MNQLDTKDHEKNCLKDPFPYANIVTKKRLVEVLEIAAANYRRGWNEATCGNYSVRGHDGVFWQSPSGISKANIRPESFIAMDLKTWLPRSNQSAKPSDETPLHAAIYHRYADANVVLHSHPPHIVKHSLTHKSFVFAGQEMIKVMGFKTHEDLLTVLIHENSQDMHQLAKDFDNFMTNLPVLVLRGHGVYSFGKTPQKALAVMECLEFLCQTAL